MTHRQNKNPFPGLFQKHLHQQWRVISLRPPSTDRMQTCLAAWENEPLSYTHRGGIEQPPGQGFIIDSHRVYLGHGTDVYQQACVDLDAWKMFPAWAVVRPLTAPQNPGQIVAMVVRIFGLWWINPCRILKRCDSSNQHGFVYGTLPEHSECGEERFMVERLPDGSVWYEIQAFSRPRHWMAWIGFPLARWWQLQFVKDSKTAMKRNSPA